MDSDKETDVECIDCGKSYIFEEMSNVYSDGIKICECGQFVYIYDLPSE
jgi:hypothetical protein